MCIYIYMQCNAVDLGRASSSISVSMWPCVCSFAIKPFAPPCCATHNFGPKSGDVFLALLLS